MAKGISISVAADTRGFLSAVRNGVIDPVEDAQAALEDVQRTSDRAGSRMERSFDGAGDGLGKVEKWGSRAGSSLEELGRDGDRAGDSVKRSMDGAQDTLSDVQRDADRTGDSLRDLSRDGERAGRDLERSFDDARRSTDKVEKAADSMGDAIQRGARKGGRSLDTEITDGADRAREGVREIGDEAASTAKEAAASFDGSAESIGDAFQEVAANAFAGFGPAGLLAGVAAAAGLGIIITKLQDGQEAAEEQKARIGELAAAYIDAGRDSSAAVDRIVDKLRDMATTTEDGVLSLQDLADLSDSSASGFRSIAQAYAGNTDALDDLIRKEKEHQRSLEDEAAAIDTTKDTSYGAAISRAEDQARLVEALQSAKSEHEAAAEAERVYLESGAAEMAAKAERTQGYADSIQESLAETGESWDTYYNAETGALDFAAYNAAIEARVTAMQNYQTNMQTLHGQISDDAYNYLVQLGADAAPLLQAYADAPNDQKARTAANWGALGAAASAEYESKLKAGLPAKIDGPTIVTKIDNSAYDRMVGGLPKRIGGPAIRMQAEIIGAKVP